MKLVSTSIFFIFISLIFSSANLLAQEAIAVACNESITTTLYFPSDIIKVIEPAENFNFQFERGTKIGLLKGSKGNPSNLSVITELGNIYSFALSYSEVVNKFNFFLKVDQAVGQVPIEKKSQIVIPKDTTAMDIPQQPEPDNLYDFDREEYYEIFCQNTYLQKAEVKRCFGKQKKIVLRLNNILVDRNEKYFVLQIENDSKREYKVQGLSFFKKTKEDQLGKIMTPRYTFNLQETIDPGSINELVYVFEKFNLTTKELVTVVLLEAETDHLVELPLSHLFVNTPTN